jgi:hypothetical protein
MREALPEVRKWLVAAEEQTSSRVSSAPVARPAVLPAD